MTNRIYEMSEKEIDRLEVLQRIESKQISQVEAAKLLGLSTRQVRSLQGRYRREGAPALVSKRRGQASNNRLKATLKESVLVLLKAQYADFGPTLAQEKLAERHGLKLSVESVRQVMLSEGLWRGKKRKRVLVHQMRARRSCLGELVQIDGSLHDWFEGRREKCCLLVFIDDATSRLMELHFAEVESTAAYYAATEHYVKRHGRPVSFYSDRHGIFRVNIAEAAKGTGETQFGRALRELDIALICANSPQAKGRVEKANGTLQDRLIKEMRLRGISDIISANAFLPEFMQEYNRRFAVEPSNPTDAHRSSIPHEEALKLLLSQQHQRKASKNLELSYNNVRYQIQQTTPSYTMRGAMITVCDRSGEITLIYKQKILNYKVFNNHNQPTEICDSKQIGHPKKAAPTKPKAAHPWRKYGEYAGKKGIVQSVAPLSH